MSSARQKDLRLSSTRYVSMRVKFVEGAVTAPTKISPENRCEHETTVCLECLSNWEDDYDVFFRRTVGGRKLLARRDANKACVETAAVQNQTIQERSKVPWKRWLQDAGIFGTNVGQTDDEMIASIQIVNDIFDEVGMPEVMFEDGGLEGLQSAVSTLVEIVIAQQAVIEKMNDQELNQLWSCGLCGDLISSRMIDVDDSHACCGCGWRDKEADKPGWVCPNCN